MYLDTTNLAFFFLIIICEHFILFSELIFQ